MIKNILISVVLLIIGVSFALAKETVDMKKSFIRATAKQLGVSVEGTFKKFNAQINFNSAKLDQSKAVIEIETGSFDLGDEDFNKEMRTKDWFNATAFPKATYSTTQIKAIGANKYEVKGKLTIKSKTVEVTNIVSVTTTKEETTFEGTLPIKRLQFDIGEGDWKDTSTVADGVDIKFRIVTINGK